jgi:hypothetical protein
VQEAIVNHIIWILLLCPVAVAVTCPMQQAKNEAALVEIEKAWARALGEHDTDTLRCILADEFEDVDVNGKMNDRSTVLAKVGTSHAVHHQLSDLHAHIHGEFAYIRGVADATDSQVKVTRVRFTDIYVFREGRWQCVAGHESFVSAGLH